jgi:hypothetical protein
MHSCTIHLCAHAPYSCTILMHHTLMQVLNSFVMVNDDSLKPMVSGVVIDGYSAAYYILMGTVQHAFCTI